MYKHFLLWIFFLIFSTFVFPSGNPQEGNSLLRKYIKEDIDYFTIFYKTIEIELAQEHLFNEELAGLVVMQFEDSKSYVESLEKLLNDLNNDKKIAQLVDSTKALDFQRNGIVQRGILIQKKCVKV